METNNNSNNNKKNKIYHKYHRRNYIITFLLYSLFCSFTNAVHITPSATASEAWDWYKSMLKKHPLVTKSVTSCCINSVSDILCQELVMSAEQKQQHDDIIEIKKEKKTKQRTKQQQQHQQSIGLDYIRIFQAGLTGLTWSGPVTHNWYKLLESIVKIIDTSDDPIIGFIVRMLLDAFLFSPFAVCGYFTYRSILEGTGFYGTYIKLKFKYISTLIGSWKFWPLANIINFTLIPLQYRVLYTSFMSLFWTGYLTYVNSQTNKQTIQKYKIK